MKRRNPSWGSPQIAEQINLAFGTCINKDVVRRILATQYSPTSPEGGPSWLAFIGHMKDSLWSLDLFRCESIALQTYWVLVVMDQYTRRIIGFGIQRGVVDGLALCRMFHRAIHPQALPKYLSSDHDPLFLFHRWQANLGVPRDPGSPNSALRSAIASVRGETNRGDPPRILGPHTILDGHRFGEQTPTLPGLLQSTPSSLGLTRTAARSGGRDHDIKL